MKSETFLKPSARSLCKQLIEKIKNFMRNEISFPVFYNFSFCTRLSERTKYVHVSRQLRRVTVAQKCQERTNIQVQTSMRLFRLELGFVRNESQKSCGNF